MLRRFNLYADRISCSPVCLTVAIPGGLLHLHTQLCDVFEEMERIISFALCSLERNASCDCFGLLNNSQAVFCTLFGGVLFNTEMHFATTLVVAKC